MEAGRKAGFLVLLVAGSAILGILIAWPLWLFATSAREVYTISVLALAAGGIGYLVVRGFLRRRSAPRDPGRPRSSAVSGFLTGLMVIVGCAGLYFAAALLAHGTWVLGAGALVIWAGLLWLLGKARGAARGRKARAVPADNRSR
jgi:hypothetical protein